MATVKQKAVLDKIIEKRGSISAAMREVGYSEATAKNPKNLTQSIGFQQLCAEHGLTEQFLVDALVDDIKNKPKHRFHEMELGFKVLGKLTERQEPNKTLVVLVSGETASRYGITPVPETSSD